MHFFYRDNNFSNCFTTLLRNILLNSFAFSYLAWTQRSGKCGWTNGWNSTQSTACPTWISTTTMIYGRQACSSTITRDRRTTWRRRTFSYAFGRMALWCIASGTIWCCIAIWIFTIFRLTFRRATWLLLLVRKSNLSLASNKYLNIFHYTKKFQRLEFVYRKGFISIIRCTQYFVLIL